MSDSSTAVGDRPHVLLLPSSYPSPRNPVGGIFYRDQALALHRAGVPVGVICPDLRSLRQVSPAALRQNHWQLTVHEDDGVPVLVRHGWSPLGDRLRARAAAAVARSLARTYSHRFGRPDLIHAHAALWGGFAARAAAAELGVPYVITEHSSLFLAGPLREPRRQQAILAFRDARVVAAVSRTLVGAVAAFTHGRDIEIIPNVVDTEYFSPSSRRPPRGPFRFVAIAMLEKRKGIHLLLEAMAQVPQVDAVLEVVGDGPERPRLERLAVDLGLAGRVRFLGRLDRGGVRLALWRADALVVASSRETFGVAIVEAMSCGLPVVAATLGGPEDIIEERSGVLVPPGDVETLAAALAEVARHRDAWSAQRGEIRRRVEERFGERTVVQALLQMYERALDEA